MLLLRWGDPLSLVHLRERLARTTDSRYDSALI
jgi:hypothetical protein